MFVMVVGFSSIISLPCPHKAMEGKPIVEKHLPLYKSFRRHHKYNSGSLCIHY